MNDIQVASITITQYQFHLLNYLHLPLRWL